MAPRPTLALWTLAAAALVAAVAAPSSAQPVPPVLARPTPQQLATQIAELDRAMRRAPDPAERKRLGEEVEKVRHQLGPYDITGARNRCQAMWHDSAIDALEIEVKRYSGRTGTTAPAPALDLKLHTRRMALACLVRGWRIFDGPYKYQLDAFGAYLANNLRTLDTLADSVGSWAAKEAKLDDSSDEKAAYKAALEKVKLGIEPMARIAEAMTKAPPDQEAELVPLLGEFLAGLRAVRDADQYVQDFAKNKGKPAGEAAPGADATAEAEAPPMTAEEKARLAKVKEMAGKLGDDWAAIAGNLERYATAAENGFQVPSARPRARELLDQIEKAARLAEGLSTSKVVPPEYVKTRISDLTRAFELIESPVTRQRGYARLADAWQEDSLRRHIEAAGLPPATAAGIVYAYYVVGVEPSSLDAEAEDIALARQARAGAAAVANGLEKSANWPPKDMAPRLLECYKRLDATFRGEVDAAGKSFPTNRVSGVPLLVSAGHRFADLDLIVRADRVVKALTKYRPAKANAVFSQACTAAQDLILKSTTPAAPRNALVAIITPFEDLDKFPMPDPDQMKAVNALVGRSYGGAVGVLTQDLATGIDAASTGMPGALAQAKEAQFLFGLLRHRAAAETYHLAKAPVSNLLAFSIPEKVWTPCLETLDRKLAGAFAQYAKEGRGKTPWIRITGDWDTLSLPVAVAQRMTLDARTEGEKDLDLLLMNLDHAATPTALTRSWQGWLVGYHATEAAVALNAGLDGVFAYHLSYVRQFDAAFRRATLEPAKK